MSSFAHRISAPFRGYINRRFGAVHEHLSRVESLVDAQSVARLERELAEVREVNQALLDSVQVLGESVARLRDEVRFLAQHSSTPSELSSAADGR